MGGCRRRGARNPKAMGCRLLSQGKLSRASVPPVLAFRRRLKPVGAPLVASVAPRWRRALPVVSPPAGAREAAETGNGFLRGLGLLSALRGCQGQVRKGTSQGLPPPCEVSGRPPPVALPQSRYGKGLAMQPFRRSYRNTGSTFCRRSGTMDSELWPSTGIPAT